MAVHTIMIPNATVATNVDAYNRPAIGEVDYDNGAVFELLSKSTTEGEGEVWVATAPVGITGLWMAYEADKIITTDGTYRGINPDSRNFFNAKGLVFSAYKPKVGDIITLTAPAFEGTYTEGTTKFANAVAGESTLTFGATQTADALSYRVLGQTYVSIGTGLMDEQRIPAYQLECVAE